MKRMMLAILFCALVAPLLSLADEVTENASRLVYSENADGTLMVTAAEEGGILDGKLVVPESHDGKIVTALQMGVFANRADIFSVELPSTLDEIAAYSFLGCSNLTNVEIQTGATRIGEGAFYTCSNMRNVVLPSTLNSIGAQAFEFCSGLQEIVLPSSLVTIGFNAFSSSGLLSVELPMSVEVLGSQSFYKCESLTNAVLSSGITEIVGETFYHCKSLQTVTLPEGVGSIGANAFSQTALVTVEIPAACTNVASFAFNSVVNMTDVYFLGDSPKCAIASFPVSAILHVRPGATGFDDPYWKGYTFDPPLQPTQLDLKIETFSVVGEKLFFVVSLTDNKGEPKELDKGQKVTLLGADELSHAFVPCGSFELAQDGSFEVAPVADRHFFKVSLQDQ